MHNYVNEWKQCITVNIQGFLTGIEEHLPVEAAMSENYNMVIKLSYWP